MVVLVSKWVLGTAIEALICKQTLRKGKKWLEKNEAFETEVKYYCDA